MKAIIQRVLSASVTVDKEVVSSIGRGVLVFAAVAPGDSEKEAQQMANKVLKMKLWDDEKGGRKGTKPDFHGAAPPEDASRLYHFFVDTVRKGYQTERVKDGRFQAMMEVALVNDGPVTLELQTGSNASAGSSEAAS